MGSQLIHIPSLSIKFFDKLSKLSLHFVKFLKVTFISEIMSGKGAACGSACGNPCQCGDNCQCGAGCSCNACKICKCGEGCQCGVGCTGPSSCQCGSGCSCK